MGDGWSAEAGGAAEAVGAVDGGRGTQPVSSTWAAKPPSPSNKTRLKIRPKMHYRKLKILNNCKLRKMTKLTWVTKLTKQTRQT